MQSSIVKKQLLLLKTIPKLGIIILKSITKQANTTQSLSLRAFSSKLRTKKQLALQMKKKRNKIKRKPKS